MSCICHEHKGNHLPRSVVWYYRDIEETRSIHTSTDRVDGISTTVSEMVDRMSMDEMSLLHLSTAPGGSDPLGAMEILHAGLVPSTT